jgi:hypothetical protein
MHGASDHRKALRQAAREPPQIPPTGRRQQARLFCWQCPINPAALRDLRHHVVPVCMIPVPRAMAPSAGPFLVAVNEFQRVGCSMHAARG